MADSTLHAALMAWLRRTPIQGSAPGDADDPAVVDAFLGEYLARNEAHQREGIEQLVRAIGSADRAAITARVETGLAATRAFLTPEDPGERRARAGLLFIESYRELPLLAWPRLLLDTVCELEEQLLLFRNRHARMVERTIGRRVGTGGSSGVEYLDQTASYRVFPELWQVRSCLLPRQALPALRGSGRYSFAVQ